MTDTATPMFVEIDPVRFAARTAAIDPHVPVTMVNLLRFRAEAHYQDGSPLPPCSGREAYFTRYMPGVRAVVDRFGGSELVFPGLAQACLVAPQSESWDAIGIVRYPHLTVFEQLISDADYITNVAPHRLAALADWRLYAATALA